MTIFLISIAFTLSISFLCSLAEAALLSLTPSQVARLSERHPRVAQIWRGFKANIERPIAVILILNTTAHTIGATVAGAQFDRIWGHEWIWVFSLAFTFAMLQFTEILPKTLGVHFNSFLAPFMAAPLAWLVRFATPLIWLLHLLNRPFEGSRRRQGQPATLDEIASLAAMARMSKDIDAQQERIILGAARLSRKKVADVMIPIEQVVMLSSGLSIPRAIVAAHLDTHTRFPIYRDDDRDEVIGYVNFKEMVYFMSTNPADPTLTGIMRPVHFADPEGSAADLLRVFVGQHEHMAIARDEDGRAIGLVTLEDLIEEVVGEVEDEFDRLPRYRHALPGGTWVFGGGTPMDEVSQSLGGLLPAGRETLATWMAKRLGVIPTGGQAVRIDDVEILVRRMRRGQVFEASVTPGH